MSKKIFLKSLILVLLVFTLSGCGIANLNLSSGGKTFIDKIVGIFLKTKVAPAFSYHPTSTAVAVNLIKATSSTASSSELSNDSSSSVVYSAASSSAEKTRNYEINKDYLLTFTSDYFFAAPKVVEVGCDFNKNCPCLSLRGFSIEEYCRSSSITRKVIGGQAFCAQERSGAAAGSTYVDYYFTMPLKNSIDRCVSLYFTKQLTTDCNVYGGTDAQAKKAQCEKEKTDAPGIIDNIVSSFKLTP